MAIRDGTHSRLFGTTVSREVTAASKAVYPRTRTSSGVSPGAQTARTKPDRAIVSDISSFPAVARIIEKERSGDRFTPSMRSDDAAVPITRLAVPVGMWGRLLRR